MSGSLQKMALYHIPNELKDLEKIEKFLISKRTLLEKIAAMHEKDEFLKTKGSIFNISIETANNI